MLMRPLNGANAELTGRVSHAAVRGVMAAVSAGNCTLSRWILAAWWESGAQSPPAGAPPPPAGLTARDTPSAQPGSSNPALPRMRCLGHSPPHIQSHTVLLHHVHPDTPQPAPGT